MKNKLNVAIIGGGFTGLVAAYELTKQGHSATIFERGPELGGLASGFKIEGQSIEKTYHHLFPTDSHIINIVKELGIEDKLTWQSGPMGTYYDGKMYSFVSAFDLLKFSPLKFWNRIRLGLMVLYLQKKKNWRPFIKQTASEWIKKWGGAEVYKVVWEPILRGKFHQYANKVSMAWFWARMHIRANSRKNALAKEQLGYFKGGFNVVVEALESKIREKGVEINLNAEVNSIISKDNKVIIKFNGEDKVFDRTVATLPSYIFAKLIQQNTNLDSNYIQQLNSIEYLGAICMVFSTEQKISEYYWHNINDSKSPFVVFLNHTNLIDKSNYAGKYIYYLGGYFPHDHQFFSLPQHELETMWFDYLKNIFPEFDKTLVREKYQFRLKNAQHIVDTDYESRIPQTKTPLENVYLSNFSQIFPEDRGTNYAVREGRKVVELILSEL